MSYDFGLVAPGLKGAGGYPVALDGYDRNCTYNVASMFSEALGCSIRDLEGRKCSEIEPILRAGIKAMREDPKTYEAMNPSNGWGNAEGALGVLEELARWCTEVPDAELGIW